MSCMVPVNSKVALERAWEALLRRREEKMALTPIKLVCVNVNTTDATTGYGTVTARKSTGA